MIMICYFFQVKITFICIIHTDIVNEDKEGNKDHGKVDDDGMLFLSS